MQWRRDKIDFGPEISRGLVRHHRAALDAVVAGHSGVGTYFDLGRLRQSVSALVAAPERTAGPELFMIWRSLVLMHWLRNRGA